MVPPVSTTADFSGPLPEINKITLDYPWQWLAAGWKDLCQAAVYSLSYGAVFVAVSYALTLALFSSHMFFLVPPLAAGFFLLAPLLGVGMYQISRSLEQGESVRVSQVLDTWDSNNVHLSAFAIILLLIMLAWIMVANLVFALFINEPLPTWENFIPAVFLSGQNMGFLLVGTLCGALIAGFTFAISVITTPLLMDRRIDVMSAIHLSWKATFKNWRPMMLWGALIVMFIGVGIVTFYIGLLVAMPLVGHATWHAYRDLVAQK